MAGGSFQPYQQNNNWIQLPQMPMGGSPIPQPRAETIYKTLLQVLAAHGQFASAWGILVCPQWSPDWTLDPKLTEELARLQSQAGSGG